jgi:hypothetical protein
MAPLELLPTTRAEAIPSTSVDVVPAASGGWDVIVTVGGRTVVVRHCADWHRVERACRLLQISLRSDPPGTRTAQDARAA